MKLFEVFGEVALKGQEAVEGSLNDIGKKAEDFSKRMDSVGKSISDTGASMTKWVTGPIAAVGGGLTALAVNAAKTGDEIAKGARAAGLSTDAYQELGFVIGQVSDVTDKQANLALQTFNRTIGDAAAGNEKAIETLNNLGFSMAEIESGTINTEEAFTRFTKQMGETKTDAEAASLAAELFGGTVGAKLGPALRAGAADVDALRKKFNDLGLGMSEEATAKAEAFNDKMDILKRQFSAITAEIGIAFIPVLMTLADIVSERVIPVLRTGAEWLAALFTAFSNLPGPVQTTVIAVIALVAALGPVLFVVGKVISVLASFKTAIMAIIGIKALLATGIGAVTGALGALVVAAAPFLAIIAAIAAAIGLAIFVWKNWDQIVRAFGVVFGEVSDKIRSGLAIAGDAVRNFGRGVLDVFRMLPQAVANYVTNMVRAVIDRVTQMVKAVVARLKSMYKQVVGNSIIPDMVAEVGQEMTHMADQGAAEAGRFNSQVQRNLSGVELSADRAAGGGSGGAVSVDMRYAVIRDDKDMLERLMRSGAGVSGVFA
jgi:hypothetical protein